MWPLPAANRDATAVRCGASVCIRMADRPSVVPAGRSDLSAAVSRRFEKLVKQNMCKIFAEIVKKKARWPACGQLTDYRKTD
jgi:hypothetical protein